jgi:hypothetical protein
MAVSSCRCEECGCTAPQNPTLAYCTTCGHHRDRHAQLCGRCRQQLDENAAFCAHCGEPVTPPDVPDPSPEQPRNDSIHPNRCTLCACPQFQLSTSGSGCARCLHPAVTHGLSSEHVEELRARERPPAPAPAPVKSPRTPGLPPRAPAGPRAAPRAATRAPLVRSTSFVPKGLIVAAWIAGIFGAIALVVGLIAASDASSSSTSTDVFGNTTSSGSSAGWGIFIVFAGVAAAWFMVCAFCAGLHGHLDRLARISFESRDELKTSIATSRTDATEREAEE